MRKRIVNILSCFFLVLLTITLCFVDNAHAGVIVIGRKPVESYDDIVFYFNCDDNTTGQSPQKTPGSETITIGANVSTTTGDIGNALVCVGKADDDIFQLSAVDGIANLSSGQIMFALKLGSECYSSTAVIDMAYRIYFSSNTNYCTFWHDDDKHVSGGGTSTSVFTYYTLKWDDATEYYAIRINDGSWIENTPDTGYVSQSSVTRMKFVGNATYNMIIDQIIISNDTDRDLYAVRNVTDFS